MSTYLSRALVLATASLTPAFRTPAQTQLWMRQFGTPARDVGRGLAPDNIGGAFLAGETGGDLGGPSAGGADVFLARYTDAGVRRWVRQYGSPGDESVRPCAPDGNGGVYICGSTTGDFGGPSAGAVDAFVGRFDASGNQVWLRQFGTSEVDRGQAAAPDDHGGVYIAGTTWGSLSGPGFGSADAFLARFDGTGALRWIRQFGTSEADGTQTVARADLGGAFVGGDTSGSLGGPRSGFVDAFISRFDSAGNQVWARQFGSNLTVYVGVLTSDGHDGAVAAGLAQGIVGPSPVGGTDAFVARYDGGGTRSWIRQFGSTRYDHALGVAADSTGTVFVGGSTQGDLAGPNMGSGTHDAYFARFSANGLPLDAVQFGTPAADEVRSAMADSGPGLWLAGWTAGNLGGPNAGSDDAWIARFADSCYPDCDTSTGPGSLDIFDFLCFNNRYEQRDPYACDCDTSTGPGDCNVFDFLCFQNAYTAGCP